MKKIALYLLLLVTALTANAQNRSIQFKDNAPWEEVLQQARQANEFAERVLAEFGRERLDKLLDESREFSELCYRLADPSKAAQ